MIFDLDYLASQTEGDQALQEELLTLFVQQALQIGALVETAHTSDSGRSLPEALHRFKGAARAVGAWRVGDETETLEQCIVEGAQSWADAGIRLQQTLRDACTEVSVFIAAHGASPLANMRENG